MLRFYIKTWVFDTIRWLTCVQEARAAFDQNQGAALQERQSWWISPTSRRTDARWNASTKPAGDGLMYQRQGLTDVLSEQIGVWRPLPRFDCCNVCFRLLQKPGHLEQASAAES